MATLFPTQQIAHRTGNVFTVETDLPPTVIVTIINIMLGVNRALSIKFQSCQVDKQTLLETCFEIK